MTGKLETERQEAKQSESTRSLSSRFGCLALTALLLGGQSFALAQFGQGFGSGFGQSIQQGFGPGPSNNALDNPNLIKKAPKELEKERKLEDFFPKAETPFLMANPYNMNGVKVPGLSEKFVPLLSQNLFVVAENGPYNSMSDIYRENRLHNKSSFVTADCIAHAYFALNNSMLKDVIYEKVMPGLLPLLQSMLKQALSDYKDADDGEVKTDISRNIAYILVALRLLDPSMKVPAMNAGLAVQASDSELKNIASEKKARSIFGSVENYAYFQPTGFYSREPKLRNFYRCRQWLSRIQFPLSDSDLGESPQDGQPESRFRQSVLLFRCLDKATVNGAPALEYWSKYTKVWELMGARITPREHPLLPSDYKTVFRTSTQNLTNLLQGLSEPFFRTKLLLSIRRNRPMELNSTSILAMKNKKDETAAERSVFRMMPLVDEPELPWLATLAQGFTDQKATTDATPFALLELYAHSSTLATNILCDTCYKLDGDLFNTIPKLIEAAERKRAVSTAPIDAGSTEGVWRIISGYFKPMTDSSQPPLKSEVWMRRRLLSAMAAWVDSHTALLIDDVKPRGAAVAASGNAGTVSGAAANGTSGAATPATGLTAPPAASSNDGGQMTNVRKAANFLEPAPIIYKNLKIKLQQTIDELTALDYMPAGRKQSAQDLLALCAKLEEIGRKIQNTNFVSAQDSRYLGTIDTELDKFPAPLPAVLHLEDETVSDKSGKITSGAILGLGKPGLIFMLLHIGRGETLSRGAEYTYYEVPGGDIKPEHWERKLQFNLAPTPKWTGDFEVQQEAQKSPATNN